MTRYSFELWRFKSSPSDSVTPDYYTYRARPVRVIDGDTVIVYIDQGFYDYTQKIIRLKGVDTAEIHNTPKDSEEHQLGQEQKQFVKDFLDSEEEWPLDVITYGEDKYGGRWIGYIMKEGTNLSVELIEEWPEVQSD